MLYKSFDIPVITLGSPFSVGYEIFLLSLDNKIFNDHTPVCIGSKTVIDLFLKELKIKRKYKSVYTNEIDKLNEKEKYDFILLNIDEENVRIDSIDSITPKIDGYYALKTIELGAVLVKDGHFKSVVTLPVNKKNINFYNKLFTGHTEFFQKKWEEDKVFMCFISGKINIILLSTHLPLKEVPKYLNPKIVDLGIKTSIDLYNRLGLTKDICFLGLNPHAGENGLLGKEEFWIEKIINKYKTDFSKLRGPVPSDTAFTDYNREKYDLYIACYHDQALIPFKIFSFEDGVNLSFGMKNIRTSVDHGTAVDLIGKKAASNASFLNAYKLAIRLSR